MTFVPFVSEAVAHSLHVLCHLEPTEPLNPAYVKADRRLRRGGRAPRPYRIPGPPAVSVRSALHASAPPEIDQDWFRLRWLAGEEAALLEHATRLAADANAVESRGLLPKEEVRIVASPAISRRGIAIADPWIVAIHPRAAGESVVLATLAERLGPALPELGLQAADARLLHLHVAGTALLAAGGEPEEVPGWLVRAAEDLLPAPAEAAVTVDRVARVARIALDQPPGEIERIASGLADRSATRLHRAWRRRFFVPPGWDLDGWIASARAE